MFLQCSEWCPGNAKGKFEVNICNESTITVSETKVRSFRIKSRNVVAERVDSRGKNWLWTKHLLMFTRLQLGLSNTCLAQ